MNESELIEKFSKVDTSDFPDFSKCSRPLDMALWVLWVSEDKLGISRLTGEQIAAIIVGAQKISIGTISIINSLNRAKDKVHRYYENDETYFEIMKPGKEFLVSQVKEGSIEVFYFEPGKKYTPKRLLAKDILAGLTGELRIVDPYCSERTLDCLKDIKGKHVKFLTKLTQRTRERFLRDLRDFKSENLDMEFKDYPNTNLHDRYIISSGSLVILGHSIKDLGAKESFAIVLHEKISGNLIEALIESFDSRWEQSTLLE